MFPQKAGTSRPGQLSSEKISATKRAVDILFSLVALPLIAIFSIVLLILNPFFNPGPLFFRQSRMGLHGKRITIWKFRTMSVGASDERPYDAPVETHRISSFGQLLRKTRIDELPNFLNVLKGEMSLVGPRPEAWGHAVEFIQKVPYYRSRFDVLPGITGLAQIRLGYADDGETVVRKARLDHIYATRHDIRMDGFIILHTFRVILTGFGAK